MTMNPEVKFTPDALRRLRIVQVEENRIALIDPRVKVDGEPIEHFTFDLTEGRTLADFLQIVIGPSLVASGMTVAEFLSQVPESFVDRDEEAS